MFWRKDRESIVPDQYPPIHQPSLPNASSIRSATLRCARHCNRLPAPATQATRSIYFNARSSVQTTVSPQHTAPPLFRQLPVDAPAHLRTDRLWLRALQPSDASAFFSSCSADPEVTRHLAWATHANVSDAENFIEACLAPQDSRHDLYWVVVQRSSGDFMGIVTCSLARPAAAIGYVLARAYWGNGFATEAARAMINWVETLDAFDHIVATCEIDNTASRRVLERLGFLNAGVKRAADTCSNISTAPRDMLWYVRSLARTRD